MKKTKIIAVIMVLLLTVALFTACAKTADTTASEAASSAPAASESVAAATEAAAAESVAAETEAAASGYDYQLGVIQPGPEAYYQNYADSVTAAAEYAGMTVTALLSQYAAETEISNVEDLISQGVDAIACFSVDSNTAQVDAQLCNEAKIPLFLMSSIAAEGDGIPTCTIGNSFYEMGHMDGEWAIANITDAANILEIQGALGQGIAEEISRGFEEAIAANTNMKIVSQQTASWKRDEAITITEDAIASGLDFNMIFVHNEDMCAGVVSVLEENDLSDKVKVITENGSDDGIAMIKNDQSWSGACNGCESSLLCGRRRGCADSEIL